jgi:hypothetical protein
MLVRRVLTVVVCGFVPMLVAAMVGGAEQQTFKLENGSYKLAISATVGGEEKKADQQVTVTVDGASVKIVRTETPDKAISGTIKDGALNVSASDLPGSIETLELSGKLTADNDVTGTLNAKTKNGDSIGGTFTLKKTS